MQQQCVYRQRTGSVRSVINKAQTIQSKLAANPIYAAVVPSVAEVSAIIEELKPLQQQIEMRNYHCKLQKDAKRKQLDMALAQQCKWINGMAQGNIDFLVNTGFNISKTPVATQQPITARITKVITLQAGLAIVKVKHIDNTRYYEVIVSGPNGYQKKVIGLNTEISVPNLPTAVLLTATVRAVNHKGIGQWSNGITFDLPISNGQSAGTSVQEEG